MIKICEVFGPTIQGEGKSIGKEVIFIRTSLCNLHCIWCDTPYTWNWTDTNFQHVEAKKYRREDEIHLMTPEQIFDRVQLIVTKRSKNIVLSGGEPLLQQNELIPLLKQLKDAGFWIEVETNGTVMPTSGFLAVVDQINCSPKLSNSNNSLRLRERPEVLHRLSRSATTNFKFVVSSIDDIPEILHLTQTYDMKDVYLMPMGITKDELDKTRLPTLELAKQYGYKFTDRLHITQLGGGRKV
jgi:7-carboxy-7-deazaguanine synthase